MDKRLKKHPLGFWEIAEKPNSQELQQYYAEKYFQESQGSYELEYTKDELQFFKGKLEQRLAVIQRYLHQPKGATRRLLDVGCGEGFALAFFREHGWSVKGIDFSSVGVKSKNPNCVDALITGDIFELLQAEIAAAKTYDVVWLQNVLEHVIDPLALLTSLRTLVSQDGLVVVTVPNDYSITQKSALSYQHIDGEFWVAIPDHLSYFDNVSLTNAANNTGWVCLELYSDFPIDWYLFNSGSNFVRDKSTGKAAHNARIQIENYIHKQPIEDVLRYWSAAANLGIGRNITAFLQRTDPKS